MNEPRGLKIERRLGESVVVNSLITITITEIKGKYVKLCVECPEEFRVERAQPYKEWVEEKSILSDLSRRSSKSRFENTRKAPRYIKFCYGKYGGYSMDCVPSYFLNFVLAKELKLSEVSNDDRLHIDLLIGELERRKSQRIEDENGIINNTIH